MARSMLPRVCFPRSTGCISSRSIRSSRREPCGASRTRSRARSRNLILSHSSRRRPSRGNFSVNCLHDLCDPVHGCDSANGIDSPSLPMDLIRSTSSKQPTDLRSDRNARNMRAPSQRLSPRRPLRSDHETLNSCSPRKEWSAASSSLYTSNTVKSLVICKRP